VVKIAYTKNKNFRDNKVCHPEPFDLAQDKLREGSPVDLSFQAGCQKTAHRAKKSQVEPQRARSFKGFLGVLSGKKRPSLWFSDKLPAQIHRDSHTSAIDSTYRLSFTGDCNLLLAKFIDYLY